MSKTGIQGELFPAVSYIDQAALEIEASPEARGAVYTRPEVVDFILDLVGYTIEKPLYEFRILEPSFGQGDFLIRIAERLLASYFDCALPGADIVKDLAAAVAAFEIHPESIEYTRENLLNLLLERQVDEETALILLSGWIRQEDFLLSDPQAFTHVVGNPPYVRQELIPPALMKEYRRRFSTIYDRADLYVPFIEKSLLSLDEGGALGFICSDRWMKNRYGGPLRSLVADRFHLTAHIDMTDTPAFHSDVTAYPAITIIKREPAGPTRVASRPEISGAALSNLAKAFKSRRIPPGSGVSQIDDVVCEQQPWLLEPNGRLKLLRRLEREYPTLEEAGCRVGIGVATGADKVFIGSSEELDVEEDRKLPLITTRDIASGSVVWQGQYVINPFKDDGTLVDLQEYPRLAEYLKNHEDPIRRRNCARKNPRNWFRTIDRIHPQLIRQPKLVIPDIKGAAHVVYESGQYYPHHNLYYVTSSDWNIEALQAVLLSEISGLFISAYSTPMRGGYLRFQAQYLRRIRVPYWRDVSAHNRDLLIQAARTKNAAACNSAVVELFGLNPSEVAVLQRTGKGNSA